MEVEEAGLDHVEGQVVDQLGAAELIGQFDSNDLNLDENATDYSCKWHDWSQQLRIFLIPSREQPADAYDDSEDSDDGKVRKGGWGVFLFRSFTDGVC